MSITILPWHLFLTGFFLILLMIVINVCFSKFHWISGVLLVLGVFFCVFATAWGDSREQQEQRQTQVFNNYFSHLSPEWQMLWKQIENEKSSSMRRFVFEKFIQENSPKTVPHLLIDDVRLFDQLDVDVTLLKPYTE